MTLRAAFPWYDLNGVQHAHATLWQALRACLATRGMTHLPVNLERHTDPSKQWRDPNLLISQMCGLDLTYEPQVAVIATPVFDLPDCPPGHYFSHIVQRKAYSGGPLRAAINHRRSHSGCSMLLAHTQPAETIETGAHAASLRALRDGRADIAAIDAVTWALVEHTRPELLEGVQCVARTTSHPAPPWVTAAGAGHEALLRTALAEVLCIDATREARETLLLRGATVLPDGAYTHMPALAATLPQ